MLTVCNQQMKSMQGLPTCYTDPGAVKPDSAAPIKSPRVKGSGAYPSTESSEAHSGGVRVHRHRKATGWRKKSVQTCQREGHEADHPG